MDEILAIFPLWLLSNPILLVFSMFCIFLYTLRMNRSSMVVTNKHPPNPPKLPIIGNLHQLLGKPRHLALWQLSQEYGPVMLLYIGTKPFLVISSSATAKQIFKTYDHIFCSRPMSKATQRLSYSYLDIAFSPHSNHWRDMRKILVSEFLGPKRARTFNHVLMTEIESMVHSLSLHPSHSPVDLTKVLFETVKEVVCKVAFGKNYRQQPHIRELNQSMLNEIIEIMNGSLGDSFPWFGRIIDRVGGMTGLLEKCFSNLDAYIEMIVNEYDHDQTFEEKSDHDKDFVHTLFELSSVENTSGHRLITKEDMKALIMDILTGGIDTTVVTMVWAMTEIARHDKVMQKLQSEIRNCIGRKQKVVEPDIKKMAYLKMVVKETLRLHPPAPLLIPHESLSHCQVGGYDIFPGTTVLINGWSIGRDPSIWGENAAEFYPERFDDIEVDLGGGNFEMVPFGGGRRSCPAMNTASAMIELTIANLLYWFDWEVPGGMKKQDLNMEEEGSLVIRKKLPLCLVPSKHNWQD